MGRSFRKRIESMGKKKLPSDVAAIVESLQKNANATPCGDVAALPDSPVGPGGKSSGACAEAGASEQKLLTYEKKGSSCMTVGGFPLHKFAWPLFYGLLSRSSGPRNFD